jgi:hypothetical protein
MSRPDRFTPGKDSRYPLYSMGRWLRCRSAQVQKNSPPTGTRSADRPTRSKSLYRLSYPSPLTPTVSQQPHVSHGLLIIKASQSYPRPAHAQTHTHTHTVFYSVGLPWACDQYDAVHSYQTKFQETDSSHFRKQPITFSSVCEHFIVNSEWNTNKCIQ